MESEIHHSHTKKDYNVLYAVIITAIAVFAISYLIFNYIPNHKQATEIHSYKKALYDSVLCQYQCPLIEQNYNNKTVNAPNASCVQECSTTFKNKQLEGQSFSDKDLLDDNLIKDIQSVIGNCKNESIIQNGNLPSVDSNKPFPCSITRLNSLKDKSPYLKEFL